MEIRDSGYFKQVSNSAHFDLMGFWWWGISYEQRIKNGINYLKDKNYDAAIIEFNEALKLNPESAEAHYYLGVAYQEKGVLYQEKGQKEDAEAAYIDSISAYQQLVLPNDSKYPPFDIHYNLGFVFNKKWELSKRTDDLSSAITEYNKAITFKAEPDLKANAHNNLGNLYEEDRKLDKAIKQFEQVVKLKPNNKTLVVTALYHLEYLYNKKIKFNSNDSRAHYNLSVIYYRTYYFTWVTKKDKTLIKKAVEHCDIAIILGYKEVSPDFVKLLRERALKFKYVIPASFLKFIK